MCTCTYLANKYVPKYMHIYLLMTSPCVETINIFYIIHYISYTYFRTNSRPHNRLIVKISMLCKFSDPNYECHNDLSTRSNSTGRIRPASKTPLKQHKKEILSLVWLHMGTIVCCASFQTQIMSGTMIYLPGRIRLVEFDRPQKDL